MTSSQMLKGVLEGCVLALVGRGETYGYELVGTLASCGLRVLPRALCTRCSCAWKRRASSPRRTASPRWARVASTTASRPEGAAEIDAFARGVAKLSDVVESVLGEELGSAAGKALGSVSRPTFEMSESIEEKVGKTHA